MKKRKHSAAPKHRKHLKAARTSKRSALSHYRDAEKYLRGVEVNLKALFHKVPHLTVAHVGRLHEIRGNIVRLISQSGEHFRGHHAA